jgi:hypothetical protein
LQTRWSEADSKLITILALAFLVALAPLIYLALDTVYTAGSPNTTQNAASKISVEALSVDSSSSNLSATLNVKNSSAIMKMSMFINGTLVGSYNYTQNGWGYECFRMMQSWGNGTSSYYFTANPYWMPMMGNWNWSYYAGGGGMMMGSGYHRSYSITMMATFADGSIANAPTVIVPNQQGTGWGCLR